VLRQHRLEVTAPLRIVRAIASRLRGADEIEARLGDASCIRDSVVLEL
jgi:hypothetical protein